MFVDWELDGEMMEDRRRIRKMVQRNGEFLVEEVIRRESLKKMKFETLGVKCCVSVCVCVCVYI